MKHTFANYLQNSGFKHFFLGGAEARPTKPVQAKAILDKVAKTRERTRFSRQRWTYMKHTFAKYRQNPGFKRFWAEARPSRPTQAKATWTKVSQTREKKRDFLSSALGKRATNSKNSYKTHVLSAFWPPKKRSEVIICQKWPKWPPNCRTKGFKTAGHYKNRVWVLSPGPRQKSDRFLSPKRP